MRNALKFAGYCGFTLGSIYLLRKLSPHDRNYILCLWLTSIITSYFDRLENQEHQAIAHTLHLLQHQLNTLNHAVAVYQQEANPSTPDVNLLHSCNGG